jgi:(E)-4-hydroxy-3-methylbut-2-enyl-diphosphate synthase
MGILLSEGIGDTLRVSLTDTPVQEVRVGQEILRSLGMRKPGPGIISCPTCGRVQVDVVGIAGRVEAELERLALRRAGRPMPVVAVMGCMVNGPGESRHADLAIAGGKGKFALYVRGRLKGTVSERDAVGALLAEVRKWKP